VLLVAAYAASDGSGEKSGPRGGRSGEGADPKNRIPTPQTEDPGSTRHRGPYLQREPASSHFFIWLPECNPLRTLAGPDPPWLLA
jgi:hypothetical protein